MSMTTEEIKAWVEQELATWKQTKAQARNDLAKMFSSGYVKCLQDVLAKLT